MRPNQDDELRPLTNEELAVTEREALRELARGVDMPFTRRQELAFGYIRAVVERAIREHEARVGLRHPRG